MVATGELNQIVPLGHGVITETSHAIVETIFVGLPLHGAIT